MTEPLTVTDAPIQALDTLAFLGAAPVGRARIKQKFDDFRVDEELGFDFTGNGEHVCVQLRKTDVSTPDTARRLSELTGVPLSAIGYAGMKDRRAVCSQWFSVQLPIEQESRLAALEGEPFTVLATQRNSRKLKVGSHRRNHFCLRLRECEGDKDAFEARLRKIRQLGVPNYFGQQRFGRDLANLTQVTALMQQVVAGAPDTHLRPAGRDFKRGMLYSAARSYLFNLVLSSRVQADTWCRYVDGDVLNLEGTDRCFRVRDGEVWDDALEQRLRQFDIHITGPLAGTIDPKDRYLSRAEAADIEDAVLRQYPTLVEGLARCGLVAARRPLRMQALDLTWEWEEDAVLQLRFSLSKGCYATSLLRELCVIKPSADTDW